MCIRDSLLRDIPAHRSGLPDLIYFADTGGYELFEVKGPGDQLQKNQRRWMKHFAANNIPHAIVDVDFTPEVKTEPPTTMLSRSLMETGPAAVDDIFKLSAP